MRKIIPALLFLMVIYLNRAYARIYDFNGQAQLPGPVIQQTILLEGGGRSGPLKYAALGDSLTLGVGSSNYGQTYPHLLAQKLTRRFSPVILTNFGQPGAKIHDVLSLQLPQALKIKPEYISLLIGVNDIHNFTRPSDFEKSLQIIINQIATQTRAELILINIPYLGDDRLLWFPFNMLLGWKTQQFNGIISRFCSGGRVRCIDLYAEKELYQKDRAFYSPDLFHPSEKGYLLWSKIINGNLRY